MSVGDLKALATEPLVTVGAHSHGHEILTMVPPDEAERSVRQSKALLEQWTGRVVEHFAYPNGRFNDAVANIVRRAGFRSAVTTVPRLWRRGDVSHAIPRIGIGRYDSIEQFKVKLVGGVASLFPWRREAV